MSTVAKNIIGLAEEILIQVDKRMLEDGALIYQRIAPSIPNAESRGMLYFSTQITNKKTESLVLQDLEFSFPQLNQLPIKAVLKQDQEIKPNKSFNYIPPGNMAIELAAPLPQKIKITARFKGMAGAVSKEWPLVAHKNHYDFMFKPELDPRYGEFVLMPHIHNKGGGYQHFAYDIKCGVVNESGGLDQSAGDSSVNSNHYAWERNIYSMADGHIVRAHDQEHDNPVAGLRLLERKNAEYISPDAVKSISSVDLGPRQVILATLGQSIIKPKIGDVQNKALGELEPLRFVLLEHDDRANNVTLRNQSLVQIKKAQSLSLIKLSDNRLLSLSQMSQQIEINLWHVDDVGNVGHLSKLTLDDYVAAQLVALSSDRYAVFGRSTKGALKLALYSWNGDVLKSQALATAGGGVMHDFQMRQLDNKYLIAAVQTENKQFKLIVWEIGSGGVIMDKGLPGTVKLSRVSEANHTGLITELSMGPLTRLDDVDGATVFIVTTRAENGTITLRLWRFKPDLKLSVAAEYVEPDVGSRLFMQEITGAIQALVYRMNDGLVKLCVQKIIAENEDGGTKYTFQHQHDATIADELVYFSNSLVQRVNQHSVVLAMALRNANGKAKVIYWQAPYNNVVTIYHDGEVVNYYHIRQGSIPDHLRQIGTVVKRGELIARVGNSGASGGPHLHIHASKVANAMAGEWEEMRRALDMNDTSLGPARPLHFGGVLACVAKNLHSGWQNNAMTLLRQQGTYFEDYVIWPAAG